MARYRCPGCDYVYDEHTGDEHEGFKPGTPWQLVPETWACPMCAVRDKIDFVKLDDAAAT
ncbi:MAG: rubredoxin [Panacagrimonas sp.]